MGNDASSDTNQKVTDQTTQVIDKKEMKENDKEKCVDNSQLHWNTNQTTDSLSITDNEQKVHWTQDIEAAWMGTQCLPILKNGIFEWEFEIGPLQNHQIGVGLMVYPPNWGFFGYLGAGANAWSYDPSTGDIVTETESMKGNLPTIDKENGGIIKVILDLKTNNTFQFVVDGKETEPVSITTWSAEYASELKKRQDFDPSHIDIDHPSIVVAASLLARNQWIKIRNFKQTE